MSNSKHIEIMSPVGSYETLMAAIQGGASSIYFGVGNLNMRSKSTNNFTYLDLQKIVSICNENNVKSYLTVNSVIYESEINQMKELINIAKNTGVNAVIASDISVIEYSHEQGVEVHASTQLNISNYQAVKFFSKYCQVMILARELTLQQTSEICSLVKENNLKGPNGNPILIELFVHGALCMSISGKCYLSLHENNHSANRGSCFQNCRRSYEVTEKESGFKLEIENEYIMSPKDLCTIHFLDKILDAGVSVLKIEGRARAPEYVKTTTSCYHEAIEAWKTNNFSKEKIAEWIEKLQTVYNRGFWEGYYLGDKLGQWSGNYGSIATKRKVYIGKVTKFFKKIQVAEIVIETGEFCLYDDLFIIGPSTGVLDCKIDQIRCNEKPVNKVQKGDICSIETSAVVRKNDKVYKWVNDLVQKK